MQKDFPFNLPGMKCRSVNKKEGKRKVGGKRYEARSRRRSSPDTLAFEPAKRPDDRADYCLDCSFLPQWKHRVLVFTLEWSGARFLGEQW